MKSKSAWLSGVWLVCSALIANIACAEVVIVSGANSPIGMLTKQQVVDIYLGRQRSFPNGEPALTSMIGSGPIKDEFLSSILEKSDSQARATWARLVFTGSGSAPKDLTSSAEVKKLVSENPNVIGVIEKSAVDKSVKVIFAP